MSNSQPLIRARYSMGDAAVDGLLNGVAAGVIMAIYLLISGVLTGAGPAATLSAFDLGRGVSPVRGTVIHLAVAAIYGMAFSLIYRLIGRRKPLGRGGTMIVGVTFSMLLWLITQMAFAAGITVALNGLPPVHLAAAHLVYGATLGWLAGRARAD